MTAIFWRQSVLPLLNRTFGSLAHWLSPSFGADFRLEPDLDRIEALSTERAALWARVDAASFLDRNEKRSAVGYGEVEGEQADIAVSDSVDEAGIDEGDVDDPQAEINKLKAQLYDLHIKYDGQPRDDAGRFSFGRGSQNNTQRPRSGGSSKPTSSGNTLVAFAPIQGIGSTSMNDAQPQNAILSGDDANLKPQLMQLEGDAQYKVNMEEEDAVNWAMDEIKSHEIKELELFLDKVLADPQAGTILKHIWNKSWSQIGMKKGDFALKLFQGVRDRIAVIQ